VLHPDGAERGGRRWAGGSAMTDRVGWNWERGPRTCSMPRRRLSWRHDMRRRCRDSAPARTCAVGRGRRVLHVRRWERANEHGTRGSGISLWGRTGQGQGARRRARDRTPRLRAHSGREQHCAGGERAHYQKADGAGHRDAERGCVRVRRATGRTHDGTSQRLAPSHHTEYPARGAPYWPSAL
jgi:hypothetical protein